MRIRFIQYIILCCLLAVPSKSFTLKKGIVVAAVADLIGDPIKQLFPDRTTEYAYAHLPWSCYRSHYAANARLHQLLFQEQVTIISTTPHEVCIEVPQVFYTTHSTNKPQTRYWTLKKNIMPLDTLSQHEQAQLPPVIDFRAPHTVHNRAVVSLLEPWHTKELGVTFSAGTRFKKTAAQPLKHMVTVYALDPKTCSMRILHIPQNKLHTQGSSRDQKIKDFIRICERWAHAQSGSIGYVLGGCSYLQTHANDNFKRAKSTLSKQSLYQYERPHEPVIKTGLDCSNLILRAAQLAGLPYFYKNTYTVAQKLRPLSRGEQIESGDILWVPGHVLIISDAHKGTVIEAHSYDGGYGTVHEIQIANAFLGISSCAALAHAYRTGKALHRLDNKGNVQQRYPLFKVLKLSSLFS